MRKFIGLKAAGATLALLAATAITLPAQTFRVVYNFGVTDNDRQAWGLIQGTSGSLYGTTLEGGTGVPYDDGTVFKITPSGELTTLYSFCSQGCWDGAFPGSGLVQATDGNFYGTTQVGGQNAPSGSVFKITPDGSLTTLYIFCTQGYPCGEGGTPSGALVQATDGFFYGATMWQGANGYGTVFKISTSGTLTTLYNFCSQSNCTDGHYPTVGLIQATDGNFYGTLYEGGGNDSCYDGCGTAFKITPSGALTTLYSFCSQSNCADGAGPYGGLTQATDGNFYGTTSSGGIYNKGTVFKITPSGTLTTLYSFCSQSNCTDGTVPEAPLVQGTDGNFYSTTGGGGANVNACYGYGCGTVFKITPGGTLTTLYSFCSRGGDHCTDGMDAVTGLVQYTNGTFYGTTEAGGTGGYGTVYSLSTGLGPFVETQTTSGKVGAPVKILGTNLTGATSVTFNGTSATFTVNATGSAIATTVPSGATTGTVQVVTPSGTLSSNVPFRVRQ